MKTILCITILFLLISPVSAEIIAYDNNGQFLGILIFSSLVFNPFQEVFTSFSLSTGDIHSQNLLYESFDCSGTPFTVENPDYIIRHGNNYYRTDHTVPTEVTLNSRNTHTLLVCGPYSGTHVAVPAREIDPPYDLPIALPIQFKVEPTKPGKWDKLYNEQY